MGLFDKIKAAAASGKDEIEKKVADKLMEEQLDPTLREHHGVPQGKVEPKEKK